MTRFKIVKLDCDGNEEYWKTVFFNSYDPKLKDSLVDAVKGQQGWFGIYSSLNEGIIIFKGEDFSYVPKNSIGLFRLLNPIFTLYNRMKYVGVGLKWDSGKWKPFVKVSKAFC